MLRKMEARGLVRHRLHERKFLYRAAVKAEEITRKISAHFIERLFEGSLADMLAHLLTTRQISREELARLEESDCGKEEEAMSFPNFTFWWHLLATVGFEVCCLAALGLLAQCIFRPAVWQRTIWQVTVICLLMLPASEWIGFGRGAAGFLFGKKLAVQNAPASGFMAANAGVARRLANRMMNPAPEALRPAVWWPGWVWLIGAAIVLGRMAAAQVLLLALRVRREKIASSSLPERVLQVAKSVGLRRKVCLLRMPETISPMAFGILRPSIGLPPGFETRFSGAEQDAVLAHELAHLAAMDLMWFLLADFASAMLWWHPLAWWARRSLHVSSELAADEATAAGARRPRFAGEMPGCIGKGNDGGARIGLGWNQRRLPLEIGKAGGTADADVQHRKPTVARLGGRDSKVCSDDFHCSDGCTVDWSDSDSRGAK